MRRMIAIALAGVSLAGCSSFSTDAFRSEPPPVTVQLESTPPGADATTSQGQSCKTPCSVTVAATDNFTVSYTLAKYQPLTVPVQVTHQAGSLFTQGKTTIDPNPVVGQLQPEAPPKRVRKPVRRHARRPKATAAPAAAQPAATAAPAAAAPAAQSPFPAAAPATPAR
ncbi:MAG TPA: hypothetical protein VHC94_07460 [Nitrobacter sp.]|nr:hypothetical protein [Nitrobacter sp.]